MPAALLIIDMQARLCTGPYAAHDAAALIERINGISQDARASGQPVVLIQHEEAEGLTHGSADWQLADGLVTATNDLRLRKTTCDSFHRTNLHALLQARGVTQLIVCGLQSEYCVDSTVRGALAHGYPVTLVSDGHSTLDNSVLTAVQISAHHNQTLAQLGSFGPRVTLVPAAEI